MARFFTSSHHHFNIFPSTFVFFLVLPHFFSFFIKLQKGTKSTSRNEIERFFAFYEHIFSVIYAKTAVKIDSFFCLTCKLSFVCISLIQIVLRKKEKKNKIKPRHSLEFTIQSISNCFNFNFNWISVFNSYTDTPFFHFPFWITSTNWTQWQ